MEPLSERQVDLINDRLVEQGLTDDAVRLDLLDHVCCLTENFMERGEAFEAAVTLAFAEFRPQEFEQIQELSLHYIHLKQNRMKKTVGILGIITSALIVFGVFFKLTHTPGANIMLVLGLAITGLAILPLMAYIGYSKTDSTQSKVTYVAGYSAAVIHCFTALFMLMHWPGALVLAILGPVVLCVVFMPLYIIKSYRTSENKILGLAKSFLILAGLVLFWGLAHRERYQFPVPVSDQHSSAIQNPIRNQPQIKSVLIGCFGIEAEPFQ